MDPMDVLIGNFHTEDTVAGGGGEELPMTLAQLEQEEKREDNSSFSDVNLDDDGEHDMDFPTTQVLVQELVDEGMEEKMLSLLGTVQCPIKASTSPAKPRQSPDEAPPSPRKAIVSPVKAIVSHVKVRASPVKMRSPLQDLSPAKLQSSHVKTLKVSVAPTPIVEILDQEVINDTPEEFRAKGAEGKFTKFFPAVSKLVETGGWQIAYGHNTLFCAMPGVQFFDFKPNINVFDSKVKACWKFIQIAGEKEDNTKDKELWNMLWPIAEKEFGWFTMACGSETWFARPNTNFENFKPNETIFQTKKRAVLKCLAVEVGDIELGDSCKGHQVITFAPREVQSAPAPAPKKVKTSLFKTPSPAIKRTTSRPGSSAKFVTPAKHVSPDSVTSSAKRKLSPSASKMSSKSSASKKKVKTNTTVSEKKTKSTPDNALSIRKGDDFNFTPPEFRCSFGIVYAKLQDEGWYHRSGMFEYDYFSPTYTDATKEIKVNFFQSQADLEEFLKVSGTWKRIENELREEHETVVDEEREKALDRHHQRLEQQAARKQKLACHGSLPAVAKPKKLSKKAVSKKVVSAPLVLQSLYHAEVEAARAAEAEEARMPRLKFGTVLKKLIKRGWYYRPGRFEYDYFKPSANPKSAVAGEDRFESASALEVYLKTTGLWEEIAEEVAHEELTKQDNPSASLRSQERPTKRSKFESPPPASAQTPKKTLNGGVQNEEVQAITNDIWANSHEFDFNE